MCIMLADETLGRVALKRYVVISLKYYATAFAKVIANLTILPTRKAETDFKTHLPCYFCELLDALYRRLL